MVLHNSKWDRKAKKQYEKKHGITSEREKQQQQEIRDSVPDLPSNSWRFDEVKDELPSSDDDIDYSKLKSVQMELPKGSLYERNIFNRENGSFSDSEDDEGTEKASKMLKEVSEAEKLKAKEMREKRAKANQLMSLKKKFGATENDDDGVDDDDFFKEMEGEKRGEVKEVVKKKVVSAPTKGQQDFLDGLLG